MPQKERTIQYCYFVKKNILEHLLTMMIPISFVEESDNGKSAKLACSCTASSFVKSSSPLTAAAKKREVFHRLAGWSAGTDAQGNIVTTCYDLLRSSQHRSVRKGIAWKLISKSRGIPAFRWCPHFPECLDSKDSQGTKSIQATNPCNSAGSGTCRNWCGNLILCRVELQPSCSRNGFGVLPDLFLQNPLKYLAAIHDGKESITIYSPRSTECKTVRYCKHMQRANESHTYLLSPLALTSVGACCHAFKCT